MRDHRSLEVAARNVIDANNYMVLATADADGRPWVSPVYFTSDGYTVFYSLLGLRTGGAALT